MEYQLSEGCATHHRNSYAAGENVMYVLSSLSGGTWQRDNGKVNRPKRVIDCWRDEISGLPCLMLVGYKGESQGYVGVPPTHPYYGMPMDLTELSVHGGLGFAHEVHRANTESFLASLFRVYEGDSLYVFGFDCGHGFDFVPAKPLPDAEVRDDEFVRNQCMWLAVQLAAAGLSE